MAIPAKIIEERKSGAGMRIMDVRLVDGSPKEGSTDTEHEYASLPLTLFFKTEAELTSFKEHIGRTPILFMTLSGSRTDGKVQVSSVKDQTWWQPAAGAKCASMASRAAEICGDLANHTDVACLQAFIPQEAIDYTNTVATLTACRLVDPTSMSQSHLLGDATDHLYQLNHVHVLPPSKTDTIKTKDDRLFAHLECWDHSKKIILGFRSKAMLQLAQLGADEQSEYEQRLAGDELRHPIMASLRLKIYQRSTASDTAATELSQSDASQQSNQLSSVVVEAMSCTLADIPNDSVEAINGALAGSPQTSERLVAVPLDKLKPSPFYNMVANGEPADKALTLLCFTQRSNGKQLSHGFRVVSERVRDATATEHGRTEHTNANQYSTVTISSVEKVADFSVTKDAICIAVISKVVAPAKPQQHAADLYIEAMETVQKADFAAAVDMMRQLQRVASMQRGDATSSDTAAWQQRKCRRLLKYPTMI
jgi:hypothetical protein